MDRMVPQEELAALATRSPAQPRAKRAPRSRRSAPSISAPSGHHREVGSLPHKAGGLSRKPGSHATQRAAQRDHCPERADIAVTVRDALRSEIEDLIGQDLAGLRALWERRWGAPPLRSTQLLRLILAWRIQAEAHGGLDRNTRRMLTRKGKGEPEGLHLGVGARLTRIWEGRTVEVIVKEAGFRWEGRLFPSLSAAATAIAGSRWNSPRFFGLRAAQ